MESASNLQHTDPWTAAQIEELIKLGVWAHETHGIPLRICRTWDDPGFGYHSLFREWSVSGTACPGAARIKQFREIVFPGIVSRANGTQEEAPDMDATQAKQLKEIHAAQVPYSGWQYKGKGTVDAWALLNNTAAQASTAVKSVAALGTKVDALKAPTLTPDQLAALATQVAAHPALAEQIAELVADKLAARLTD
ncbi:hypothetical protein J7E93_02580 [Streptomyces sp. ISL-36]|uniref:hypothetical protein n=1 Tax=Streptomyces sp. ISL-36 TaxID=2819182 RepID=UPI001BE7A6EA|nr:hypothetical protein [Streptomyces sp. ISL-36]MBT2439023.1 hypothetical protein [Streptomyces sp. ISL-36]